MEALSIEFSGYFRVYKDELKEVMKLCIGTGVPNPSELLQQNVPANVLRNRASEAYRKDLHRRISHIDYFTNGVAITVTCLFVGRYLAQFSNSNPEQSRRQLESMNNTAIQIVGNNLNWGKIWQDVESNTAVLVFRIYDIQDYGEDDLWLFRYSMSLNDLQRQWWLPASLEAMVETRGVQDACRQAQQCPAQLESEAPHTVTG
ncbi:hypothetical protein SUGI_0541660 [Cryptomeria japonica]|nr:hypothetical protein SUGI_0541660 [Cryptomeria japonica]